MGRTLFDKIWDSHVVSALEGGSPSLPGRQGARTPSGPSVLYIDAHLIHEVTSPQAFAELRARGLKVRRPDKTFATVDHAIPTRTIPVQMWPADAQLQVKTLGENTREQGISYFDISDNRQGIVHVVGPEQGITQPGMTIVCGDSHTSTHGAFGALAFGIGTSEVGHVLATQCLMQERPKTFAINVNGALPPGVGAKDLILAIIGQNGVGGGAGYVFEYRGEAIRALDMAGRMTVCNMSIEGGARAGLIAPDATTYDYLRGRPMAPKDFEAAITRWSQLYSDADARFDREMDLDATKLAPMVTYGTNPGQSVAVTGSVPSPDDLPDPRDRASLEQALAYMGLTGGQRMEGQKVDVVFIGSCTNGRLEDLRQAAEVVRGHRVRDNVQALVVPGSQWIKAQAEKEGLDRIFSEAGFEWRGAGCSMCLAMNDDKAKAGQYVASTSNRNFQGRQGPGSRTMLMSPSMAAAAAIHGHLVDVRQMAPALV